VERWPVTNSHRGDEDLGVEVVISGRPFRKVEEEAQADKVECHCGLYSAGCWAAEAQVDRSITVPAVDGPIVERVPIWRRNVVEGAVIADVVCPTSLECPRVEISRRRRYGAERQGCDDSGFEELRHARGDQPDLARMKLKRLRARRSKAATRVGTTIRTVRRFKCRPRSAGSYPPWRL